MRIEKLQQLLSKKKLYAFIIDNPVDLFYLTGLELSKGRLFISKNEVCLFVDGRYYDACLRMTKLTVCHSENDGFKKFLRGQKGGKKIGFDANYTSYESFIQLSSLCGEKFTLVAVERPCLSLRAIKEREEIAQIKEAALLNSRAMHYASTLLKEGVLEEEIVQQIEVFFLLNGGQKTSFPPIVAFGENAAECHYHPSLRRALKKGDCVLIDIGVAINHYHSDLTRTFFFGKPHPEIKAIYQTVLQALHAALKLCRPGISVNEVDQAVHSVIDQAGFGHFFPHATGHGVGLEIHEPPRIKDDKTLLQDGMVVTIEPGIYIPGLGGVRLEELITITKKGYQNLTPKKWALDAAKK